ncbi:hypothetical protein KEJ47_08945, partial [Candidatus Bathyarchaeota archaeon]|nr:hypothetical protein [Candidatus Bathyarchaeota archaeon]
VDLCVWEHKANEGVLKIGLFDGYRLLAELGDELGSLLESQSMRDLLKRRNESILAHGLTPVREETYRKLKLEVYEAVKAHISNFDQLVKDSEFPRLELVPQ